MLRLSQTNSKIKKYSICCDLFNLSLKNKIFTTIICMRMFHLINSKNTFKLIDQISSFESGYLILQFFHLEFSDYKNVKNNIIYKLKIEDKDVLNKFVTLIIGNLKYVLYKLNIYKLIKMIRFRKNRNKNYISSNYYDTYSEIKDFLNKVNYEIIENFRFNEKNLRFNPIFVTCIILAKKNNNV